MFVFSDLLSLDIPDLGTTSSCMALYLCLLFMNIHDYLRLNIVHCVGGVDTCLYYHLY